MTAEPETFKEPDVASQRAAEFWEQRRFASWDAADQVKLDAWLEESALHRVAWLRVTAIAARTDALANVYNFKNGGIATKSSRRPGLRRQARRFVIPLFAMAAAFLLVEFGIPIVSSWLAPGPRSLATDIGGRTLIRFTDGTEFELNTDSAVHYQMTSRERTVWLDRGEVWFHVTHNPKVPFSAIVDNHRITDIGTEFDVRRSPDRVEVALMNGSASLGTAGVQTVALRPGDDAVATASSIKIAHKTPAALADKLAWRKGMLVFRNERLADVVRELNRYNTVKLVIADPAVGDERISTDLKADDLEKFVALTQGVLNLRVDRNGNEILFSRGTRHGGRSRAHD